MRNLLMGLLLAASAAGGGTPTPTGAQSDATRDAIVEKVADVRRRLEAVPDAQGLRQACAGGLAAAERAAEAGRHLAAVASLRRCLTFVGSLEVLAAKQSAIGTDLAAFRREWERAGGELAARRAALGASPGAARPLAIRAMIESELQTFDTYYQSALLYGENTTVESGLLYLGFPYGILDFAEFASSLPIAAPAAAPDLPDLGGALFALDGELLDFYKAQTSPEMRGALAGTNSIFKVAQDLQAARMPRGALLEYLRAIESLGANRARAAVPPDAASLRSRLAQYAPARGDVDNTIAAFFVERANGLLAPAEPAAAKADAGEPGDDLRRAAAVIVDSVLPAYDRVLDGDIPASPQLASATGKPVTVTLVRWPYT